ncbi:MAG: GDSL-type esterase/lipase family protein [Clostridiaceae bacterium]|nr:GDSL-type esterase/lipase family protein [Clostridiaceae bacterium]
MKKWLIILLVVTTVMINMTSCGHAKIITGDKQGSVMLHGDNEYPYSGQAGATGVFDNEELTEDQNSENIVASDEKSLDEMMKETADIQKMKSVEEFFSDALFIGDSRTVGLQKYSGIPTADYFAATGMNVFNVLTASPEVAGRGNINLETVLSLKKYGKIYLMLGINELGYDMDSIYQKYGEVLERVTELQPEANIYAEANLHVTKARSDKDTVFNNISIDTINGKIKSLAKENGIGYLDVNPMFDDGQGALSEDYTYDHTHVLGKYYKAWSVWIYESCHQE